MMRLRDSSTGNVTALSLCMSVERYRYAVIAKALEVTSYKSHRVNV